MFDEIMEMDSIGLFYCIAVILAASLIVIYLVWTKRFRTLFYTVAFFITLFISFHIANSFSFPLNRYAFIMGPVVTDMCGLIPLSAYNFKPEESLENISISNLMIAVIVFYIVVLGASYGMHSFGWTAGTM